MITIPIHHFSYLNTDADLGTGQSILKVEFNLKYFIK